VLVIWRKHTSLRPNKARAHRDFCVVLKPPTTFIFSLLIKYITLNYVDIFLFFYATLHVLGSWGNSLQHNILTNVKLRWHSLYQNDYAPARRYLQSAPTIFTCNKYKQAVADRGEIGREGCEISSLVAGPSPRFSSRGSQKPDGGAKKQKGGHIFKIQYWMYAATGVPNVKWGVHRFQMGGGHHWPPAGDGPVWLNIRNCRPGCFYD